jgi:ATP-dependent helicase/nuclease subunit B
MGPQGSFKFEVQTLATIRVFTSASASERLAAAREFLRDLPPAAEALLVGAGRDAVDDLVWSSPAAATFGLQRLSFTQLAARLATAQFARQRLAHSTPLGSEAVAARATFEALEQRGLKYFLPVASCPGFPRALAATLSELRLAGISAGPLAGLSAGGHDLAELLRRFEDQLAASGCADRAMLFEAALHAVQAGEQPPFPLLFLDVCFHSPAESKLAAELARNAPQVLVTIPASDGRTLHTWASMSGRAGQGTPAAATKPDGMSLERLRDHLFSEIALPEAASDESVSFFSAPGEARECVEITRRLLQEAERGTAFDKMAILLRDPGTYCGLVETALDRAHIPTYFSRGTLRPDPSGRAFLALLACAAEKLSARRFAEYLSLGQVPQPTEAGAPPQDRHTWLAPRDEALGPAVTAAATLEEATTGAAEADQEQTPQGADREDAGAIAGSLRAPHKWEQLLVEAAVIGGKDRWERRLSGKAIELRLQQEALRLEEPDSPKLLTLEREIRNLDHLSRFALPVIQSLTEFPSRALWGVWIGLLDALAPRVLSHPERVQRVLAELQPMAEIGPVGLEEVRDVLTPRLTSLEQEPPRYPYGHVFVATPEQARGRSFEVVFVPGLAERIFPRRPREDPLLLDQFRSALSPDGSDEKLLRTQEVRIQEERLHLRLAAGAATRRIYLSYPRIEVLTARQRVPSFYAMDVRRAITGIIPGFETLQLEAEEESKSRLAWPAPADPAEAIDTMEYDLAVLGRLLEGPQSSSARSHARYLLRLNDHLARSLTSRHARWDHDKWTAFDGLCEPLAGVKEALAEHRLTRRPYSVSALQKFAVCPYRFLLSAIYRLEPREDPAPLEQMDPLTYGKLFHEAQAELMRSLRQAQTLPISSSNLPGILEQLDKVLERLSAKWQEELAPAIQRIWQDAFETMTTDLRAWLQKVAEVPEREGWLPDRFEFGFGFPPEEGRDPLSIPEPVILDGGYKLHGWVDMIERKLGQTGKQPVLRVTDHKTGIDRNQQKGLLITGGGEVLQPVLYSLAVEKALGAHVEEGRLFFCTSKGGFATRSVKMTDKARHSGPRVLEIIEHAIEDVFLPPAPKERACRWCDFRDVCGPNEERRAARKEAALPEDGENKMTSLIELRGMP